MRRRITKIPVLPISYADAQPLLAALKGEVVPDAWRGSLPQTYHVGPGPAKVHLKVQSNWDIKPLYDVIVKIPGSTNPDEWVVRGNHHDAWVNGAEDPISGTVALMEEARAFATLLKQGWKPKRTIIYCVWDGEEPGLLGSTEWGEAHADELRQHAVAYINSDGNGRGYLSMGGSHTLEKFINGVARDIQDPEKKIPVWKRDQLKAIADAKTPEDRKEVARPGRPPHQRSGLGIRLDRLSRSSGHRVAGPRYGDEDGGGIYHSIYDDFYWYTHFSDTDFSYGRALSQTAGTAVMRLADADLLPYDFTGLADTIHRYLDELQKLLQTKQDDAIERNKEIEEGVFTATPIRRKLRCHLQPRRSATSELRAPAKRFGRADAQR